MQISVPILYPRRGSPALAALTLFLVLASPARGQEEPQPATVLRPSPSTATVVLEPAGSADSMIRELEIERGKSVFVKTTYNVKRVSVGSPELVDVVVLNPNELQFVAKQTGSTNVLLWDTSGRPQASIVVLVGTAESYLERELTRILPGGEIRVDSAAGATVLRGSVPNALAAEQAVMLARAYAGKEEADRVVNLLEVGGNQQVMLKVVIAEMSRTLGREMGTNFNALIESGNNVIGLANLLGGLTAPQENGTILLSDMVSLAASFSGFGGLELLEVFMDLLDERGLTKVLAEPTLVARSGEAANFLVGGEVPIPVAQGGAFGSITVEYKPFGVGLAFTPTVLDEGRIHLQVAPEVSQPDFTFGTEVGGTIVPAFNARRASTSVELKPGQSFVIAGLLAEELREQISMYPVLGQVPLLGALFRSSRYQKQETELVIIVTPSLVKPLGPGPHRLPTDSFVDPNMLEFYLNGWLEGIPPRGDGDAGLIGDAGYRISTDQATEGPSND